MFKYTTLVSFVMVEILLYIYFVTLHSFSRKNKQINKQTNKQFELSQLKLLLVSPF